MEHAGCPGQRAHCSGGISAGPCGGADSHNASSDAAGDGWLEHQHFPRTVRAHGEPRLVRNGTCRHRTAADRGGGISHHHRGKSRQPAVRAADHRCGGAREDRVRQSPCAAGQEPRRRSTEVVPQGRPCRLDQPFPGGQGRYRQPSAKGGGRGLQRGGRSPERT